MKKQAKLILLTRNWFGKVMLLTFSCDDNDLLSIIPGQFVNVMIPPKLARAYSVSFIEKRSDNKIILELCIEYIEGGKGSEYFKNLEFGDEIEIRYPFGHFIPTCFNTENSNSTFDEITFIATGTGIVPIHFIIRKLVQLITTGNKIIYKKIKLFHGIRKEEEIYYHSRFLEIVEIFSKNQIEFDYELWISKPSDLYLGNRGRFTNSMTNYEFSKKSEILICGNGTAVVEIIEILKNKQVSLDQISFERYN